MIKPEQSEHYPDMQAGVAGLDLGVLPTAGVDRTEERAARANRLVRVEFSFIWRLLRRLGLSAEDADDGAQQVFLVASRRIDAIKIGSERSFLFGTALRVAARMRKQRTARVNSEVVLLESHHDPGLRPDDHAERSRARALLDEILSKMPDDLRVAFVLYEIEELTMAEMASMLEIPMGTVASRLRRARELFAAEVAVLQRSAKGGSHG